MSWRLVQGLPYRAIERFHSTLISMIRTFVEAQFKEWHEALPFVLFAVRDAPTKSLGFSPFELIFGHEVRGPLHLFKELVMDFTTPRLELSLMIICII